MAAIAASSGVATEVAMTGVTRAAARSPTTAALTPRSADRAPGQPRIASHAGSTPTSEEQRRQEDRDDRDDAADDAARRQHADRPEIAGEREQRSGDRLGETVAREEPVVAHPARVDDGRVQQRQHDVAAAEHERAAPVERVERRHDR